MSINSIIDAVFMKKYKQERMKQELLNNQILRFDSEIFKSLVETITGAHLFQIEWTVTINFYEGIACNNQLLKRLIAIVHPYLKWVQI